MLHWKASLKEKTSSTGLPESGSNLEEKVKYFKNLFDPASKTGIESKAQLITANDEIKAASAAEKVLRIIKNLQPISMGV